MNLNEVKLRFVDAFKNNQRRRHLFQLLEAFIQEILVSGIPCDVWLDGSLLTEKPNPSDLDVTVIVDDDVTNRLTPEQKALIDRISNGQMGVDIDSFAFNKLDCGHPDYMDEHLDPAYSWGEQYGLETSEQWLKGFVIMRLRETNVGLRIRS